MGLSASQARLLSITQRLNNNELEAQIIAMQKMHLSDRNTAACDKYVNALDATKLDYISYNDTGIQEAVAFTFNSMNQYTPLKNQYALFNNENQIYVNSKDAQNFENSNSLYDFLSKYGLFERGLEEWRTQDAKINEDHAKWEQERDEFLKAQEDFNNKTSQDWIQYENDKKDWEDVQWTQYEESPEYIKYKKYQEAIDNGTISQTLQTDFIKAVTDGNPSDTKDPSYHYSRALGNTVACFLHVMNNLVEADSKSYYTTMQTSDGKTISSLDAHSYKMENLYPTADIIFGEFKELYLCDGIDVGTDGTKNLFEITRENGTEVTDLIKLASDHIEIDNGDGTYSYELKTLAQKTIDMYYLIQNDSTYNISSLGINVSDVLKNYVEGDMAYIAPTAPPYNPAPYPYSEPIFNKTLRDEPLPEDYKDKIYDKPLAQWYTNLWHLMDGNAKSDEVYTVFDEQADFDYFTVPDQIKVSASHNGNKNYVIMKDANAGDAGWLQFALNNGLVTIAQAGLRNNISGSDITWEGIELSSTSDIREVQDSSKIAKAEAEYKSSLAEIQAEDKKFDAEIKKLDTEHSAFLKEIESIKGVMQKNTEKSFTAFS